MVEKFSDEQKLSETVHLNLREVSTGVFYPENQPIFVTTAHITFLKQVAISTPRRRARLCFHPSPGETLHEMLIVHHRTCYVRPHAHLRNAESLLVLEGCADALLFDADGRIADIRSMAAGDAPRRGSSHYYRIPPRRLHALLIRSEWLVFQEVAQGPFDPAMTDFPDWAPGVDATDAIGIAWLENQIHEKPHSL